MTVSPLLDQELLNVIQSPLNEALLGNSPLIHEVNDLIQRLASSTITVLIMGESGTGKDIAARLLHKLSRRHGKPFIKVNCPAIPESILESELFGYERGAFTGARTSKPGRFELANNGTLFLDEIAETSHSVQSKLLQVLEGEPFMRIGGVRPVHTSVRIIAATNVSLEEAVEQGRFREDIYFRLSEVIIRMPALREQPEDIPLLTEHFNYNYSNKLGKEYQPFPTEVIAQLQELDWPGNVRELAAQVKKAVTAGDYVALFSGEAAMKPPRFSQARREPVNSPGKVDEKKRFTPLKEAARQAVETTERALIEDALRYTLWNRRKAAELLDISYSSLLRRIEAYSIGKNDGE